MTRPIHRIMLHCSASTWGDARVIDEWHRERGWREIGYHYVILNGRRGARSGYDARIDGLIETGRAEEEIGAHVGGHNRDSLGVCLIGGPGKFTVAQHYAAATLLHRLIERHRLRISNVIGHYELDPRKSCPGLDMDRLRTGLGARVRPTWSPA